MAYNLWWEDYDWAHAYNLVYNLEGEDCQEFQFEGEDYDVAGQDGDHDIDIVAELLRAGVEGLPSRKCGRVLVGGRVLAGAAQRDQPHVQNHSV